MKKVHRVYKGNHFWGTDKREDKDVLRIEYNEENCFCDVCYTNGEIVRVFNPDRIYYTEVEDEPVVIKYQLQFPNIKSCEDVVELSKLLSNLGKDMNQYG